MRLPPPSTARATQQAAFTLLEALLALFIFSIAVVSLIEAINSMGRTAAVSRQERLVQARLETLLVEATRSPDVLNKARSNQLEDKTVKEGSVTYVVRTKPLELKNEDEQPLADLFVVTAVARWLEGRVEQEVSAQTWMFPLLFQPQR
ncbi:MAG: type IV pilus modification PilV family protein [Roseimicrobium sp.]